MELKTLLKKGFAVLLVKLVGTFLSFVLVFLLARTLGASGFGAYYLAFTIVSIASVFAKWGLDIFLLKKVVSEKSSFLEVKGYVYSSLVFVLITSILVVFFLFFTSDLFFISIETSEALKLLIWTIIPFSLMYVASESFKSIGRPVLATLLQNIIIPLVGVIFLLVMNYFYEFGLVEAVIGYSMGVIIAFMLTVRYVLSEYPYESVKWVKWKSLYSAGKPMLLISAGALVMSWTDILVLGFFASEAEVGMYAVATKVVMLTSLSLIAMNAITAPKYALLYKENKMQELGQLAQKSSLVLFGLALFSSAFIFIFSREMMGVFGTEFIEGAWVLVILAVGQLVNVSCGSVGYLLIMTGREKTMRSIILVTAVINVLLSLIFVNLWGMFGVAYATVFSVILWNIWALIKVKKHLNFWIFGAVTLFRT